MSKLTRITLAAIVLRSLSAQAVPQTKQFPLESTAGLVLHNVTAGAATLDGKWLTG